MSKHAKDQLVAAKRVKEIMRAVYVMLLAVMLLTPAVRAQDDRRGQISAATARAVEGLRAQIAAEPVARNVTVGDILKATDGAATLRKTLCRAQMIGGPRWIDDQTCEVQLEMSGLRVKNALLQIVDANPKKSPITSDVLEMRLRDWNDRTFAATGTSTGAAAVANVVPVAGAWRNVTDESRQQAIAAARNNATAAVIEEIKPIKLANGKTVGDVLADAQARAGVEKWVTAQPVTQVEFRDDLQVRVTVATPADELFETFRAAAGKAISLDDATWSRVQDDFAINVAPTTRGAAKAGAAGGVAQRAIMLPAQPPAWVGNQLIADGVAPAGDSQLKSARAAEADAQARLRAQIDSLPLVAGVSVGEAAKGDPHFNDAVDRAIYRARPTKVDYQSDRSTRVRLSLDLRTLWDEISNSR
jgi:hypothetical protein